MVGSHKRVRRVVCDPGIMHGEPVVRGTRVTVSVIVGSLADGMTVPQLLEAFPQLTEADVRACLRYAAETARSDVSYGVAR